MRTKKQNSDEIYEIVGILYDEPENIQVKSQITGTNKIITESVCDVYENKTLLEKFPTMQGIFLGVLCHAQRQGDVSRFQNMSLNTLYYFKILPFLSMFFIATLVLSNLVATKLITLFGIDFYASIVCFPLIYFMVVIITEVYGYKYTRRLIWSSIFFNLFFITSIIITLYLPGSPGWHFNKVYEMLFGKIPRTVLSSITSTTIGLLTQAYFLAKWKVKFHARYFIIRAFFSMLIGVFLDGTIFSVLAYHSMVSFPELLRLIYSNLAAKTAIISIGVFFIYPIIERIKGIDKMDYYDYKTNFNPFLIRLDDHR